MTSFRRIINELTFIIWLFLLQVLILNRVNFLGSINPYFYVIYVLKFRADKNKYLFLFFSFFYLSVFVEREDLDREREGGKKNMIKNEGETLGARGIFSVPVFVID